jgi:hypothetical protein
MLGFPAEQAVSHVYACNQASDYGRVGMLVDPDQAGHSGFVEAPQALVREQPLARFVLKQLRVIARP